jgi:hypothetical protein
MIALIGGAASGDDGSFTLEELIAAHEQSLGLVSAIGFDMKIERNAYAGTELQRSQTDHWRWAYDVTRERLRYSDGSPPNEQGLPTGLYDWFVDGNSTSVLRNWDWEKPQQIAPAAQGTVRAQISPTERRPPGVRDPMWHLLWRVGESEGGERWTLREYVEASDAVELLGPKTVDQSNLWVIRARHPRDHLDPNGPTTPDITIDVYIDPTVNFSIRRIVQTQNGVNKRIGGEDETYSIVTTRTVREFEDCSNGIHVPTKIEMRSTAGTSDQREVRVDVRVENLKVNDAVSPTAFDFRFPPNVLVVQTPAERPDLQKVTLWGPDNRPAKEIRSPADIPGFDEARMRDPLRPATSIADDAQNGSSSLRSVVIAVNLAAIVVFAAYLAWRRARRNHKE